MKKVLAVFIFFSLCELSWSQQVPVFSQHFLNPYLYNPAYAGIDGAFSAFLTYRNQWVGIEDSPVTANVSFHTPLPNQLLVGANIFSDKRGLLNTTSGFATIGYKLPLGDAQSFQFALSAGIGSQKLDMDGIDLSDPAVVNAMENSSYLAGNFGVVYQREELRLGFGLPRIFDNNVISETSFQEIDFNPFSAYNVSARYKYHFKNSDLALEPTILYRGEENVSGQLDLVALLYYQNVVWVGGSYRLDYGPSIFLGVNVMEKLHVGYGYELATDQVAGIGNGSHEIQLKFSLAKDKREHTQKKQDEFIHQMAERRAKAQAQRDSVAAAEQQKKDEPAIAPVVVPAVVATGESETEEADPELDTAPSVAEPVTPPPGARPRLDTHKAMDFNAIIIDHQDQAIRVTKGEHLFELHHGHYVVVAAFYNTADAVAYSDHLFEDFELETKYGYVTDTQHWYVYEFYSEESHEAAENAREQAIEIPAYHDSWILIVE